ncbi:TetR/AcrR family transcriptional regulator [Streptomonospora nanhaiensis]|uniref:TetR/AcrR family fatty acid metabolism transcriptional regulator n=1 Tax=Streptomonospora nanhaiensis TaxID=1323731 RepID=A0A853BN41_9ACTN|nr:TetR/AcrR family transcriptional regulator [Streptomonospora nanhaiensis]MBX9389434.1 TetR/AcrR family transcriptional regulator [Streptomonospora nanhaiensis]NYI95941.1 TetR/AcrR family fatty acid metabolism transcriptional regulator [Streptomonospora nanhaiensis]
MAPKRVDRAARREDILDAAVRVFARRGFAATRIEDVAAEAAIAKGSVYLYFDSRDALLRAAFERVAARSERLAAAAARPGAPAVERLAGMIRGAVAMLAAEPDLARIMVDLWSTGRARPGTPAEPAAAPLDLAEVYRGYRSLIAGLLAEAGREGDLRPGLGGPEATVVVAAIEGALVQWLVDPEVPFADLAEPIVATCLDGLRPRPAG